MAAEESYESFIENIKKLFNNATYSDLIVKCGDQKWHAHKAIVCSRSNWFACALKHAMKEAAKNTIELKELDPDVVEAMLRYLYTFDYEENKTDPTTSIIFNVHVHTAADQFGLASLEDLAATKFEEHAWEEWKTKEFADAAEAVYASAADRNGALRKCVIDVASKNAKTLYTQDFGARFREVASQTPALNAELTAELAKRLEPELASADDGNEFYACGQCDYSRYIASKLDDDLYYCEGCNSYRDGTGWFSTD